MTPAIERLQARRRTALDRSPDADATAVVAGAALTLDGSGSRAGCGASISRYQWSITSGSSLADFSSAVNAASATLGTTAARRVGSWAGSSL